MPEQKLESRDTLCCAAAVWGGSEIFLWQSKFAFYNLLLCSPESNDFIKLSSILLSPSRSSENFYDDLVSLFGRSLVRIECVAISSSLPKRPKGRRCESSENCSIDARDRGGDPDSFQRFQPVLELDLNAWAAFSGEKTSRGGGRERTWGIMKNNIFI